SARWLFSSFMASCRLHTLTRTYSPHSHPRNTLKKSRGPNTPQDAADFAAMQNALQNRERTNSPRPLAHADNPSGEFNTIGAEGWPGTQSAEYSYDRTMKPKAPPCDLLSQRQYAEVLPNPDFNNADNYIEP